MCQNLDAVSKEIEPIKPKFQSLNVYSKISYPDNDDDEEHSHDEHQGCEEPDGTGEKGHVPTHERVRRLIST